MGLFRTINTAVLSADMADEPAPTFRSRRTIRGPIATDFQNKPEHISEAAPSGGYFDAFAERVATMRTAKNS